MEQKKINIVVSSLNKSNLPSHEVHFSVDNDGYLFEQDEKDVEIHDSTTIEIMENGNSMKTDYIEDGCSGRLQAHSSSSLPDRSKKKKIKLFNSTAYSIVSEPSEKSKKNFCFSWFSIPEFSSWLDTSTIPNHAYCKVCNKDLTAGKSELYRHLNTAKHKRRARIILQNVQDTGTNDQSVFDTFESPEVSTTIINNLQPDSHSNLSAALSDKKMEIYMADDMHVPLSEILRSVFLANSHSNNASNDNFGVNRIRELEQKAARLLGKDDAMFVLTGTISNTLAVLAHCKYSYATVLAGDKSFLYRRCQPALAKMMGISIKALRNSTDGGIELEDLPLMLQQCKNNYSRPGLLCIENPHTEVGGLVLSTQYLHMVQRVCKKYGLAVHMDGARLFHAAHHSGVSVSSIAQYAHTVTLCFNKGLDAINGSIVAGDENFIKRCRELSKMYGLQGVNLQNYAAAASKALLHRVLHISRANVYAKNIIRGLSSMQSSAVTLALDCTEESCTNAIILECDCVRVQPQQLLLRLQEAPEVEVECIKERIIVIGRLWNANSLRLMTHSGLSSEDVAAVVKKLRYIVYCEYDRFLLVECVS